LTDAVDKVAVEQRIGNNRILVSRSLNQYCATACVLIQCCRFAPRKSFIDSIDPKQPYHARSYAWVDEPSSAQAGLPI